MKTSVQNKVLSRAIKEMLPSNFKTLNVAQKHNVLFREILPGVDLPSEIKSAARNIIGQNAVVAYEREADFLRIDAKVGSVELERAISLCVEASDIANELGRTMVAFRLDRKSQTIQIRADNQVRETEYMLNY